MIYATDAIFITALLYLAMYIGLMCRGTGGKEISPDWPQGRPPLVISPMKWLQEHGYFYIRDQVAYSLFLTPLYSLPFLHYYGLPLWLAPIYSIGVCLGGLMGLNDWYSFTHPSDYREGFVRMLHYAPLFLSLGWFTDNIIPGIGATIIYALLAPLAYYLRTKITYRYRSQLAEGFNAALCAILSAGIILWA